MSDRWIPVLAAFVGVLGGMGGALVGGSVANQGQEQRFESERRAAMQDVRQEAYQAHLQAAIATLLQLQLEPQGCPLGEEYVELVRTTAATESVVFLLADRELFNVTRELTNALARCDEGTVQGLLPRFIDLAQEDIADPDG